MKSTRALGLITNLFEKREKELNNLIGNLQYDEVKSDGDIQKTINDIENRLLIEPVTIGSPKIVGHRSEQRNMPPNHQNLWGESKPSTL